MIVGFPDHTHLLFVGFDLTDVFSDKSSTEYSKASYPISSFFPSLSFSLNERGTMYILDRIIAYSTASTFNMRYQNTCIELKQLAVPRGCLQFVIVVFPDHTHLLFWMQTIPSHQLSYCAKETHHRM